MSSKIVDTIRTVITFTLQVMFVTYAFFLVLTWLFQFEIVKSCLNALSSLLINTSYVNILFVTVSIICFVLLYKQKVSNILTVLKTKTYYKIMGVGMLGFGYLATQGTQNPQPLLFLLSFYIVLLIIGSLGLLAWKSLVTPSKPAPLYLTDSTELNDEVFILNQQKVQEAIKSIIKTGSPTSIALTGEWGSGKSTIMQQVEKEINDVTWVNFKPWSYTNESAMVAGFYETILSNLNEQNKYVASSLAILKKPIENLIGEKRLLGLAGVFINFVHFRLNVKTPEERINTIITKTGAKIVIVVDDIERNYNGELINRTLQLAHYAKQLKSTQIIMLFEREALVQTRPKSATSAQEYLEKFFELEFKLSIPTPEELEPYLIRLIKKHLRVEVQSIPNELLTDIGTYRSAIRLLNELIYQQKNMDTLSLDTTQYFHRSIEFTDILFISHIKLRYPMLYADIQKHRGLYTQPGSYERMDFQPSDMGVPGNKARQHITEVFKDMELTDEEAERLEALLINYFPGLAYNLKLQQSNTSSIELETRNRIGSRVILDWYFGLSSALDEQIDYEEAVAEIITAINKPRTNVEDLINRFESFLVYLIEFKKSSEAIEMLFREIPKQPGFRRSSKVVLRSAFIAFMSLPAGAADRERMDFLAALYELMRQSTQTTNEAEKQAYLEEILNPYHVSRRLNNALLAAYVTNFNFSATARYFGDTVSSRFRDELEKRALRIINKNYPPADLFAQGLSAAQVVYTIETWYNLEQKHTLKPEKQKSRSYIKYLAARYPSSLLELFQNFEDKTPILIALDRSNEQLLKTYLPYIKRSPGLSKQDKNTVRELEKFIASDSA